MNATTIHKYINKYLKNILYSKNFRIFSPLNKIIFFNITYFFKFVYGAKIELEQGKMRKELDSEKTADILEKLSLIFKIADLKGSDMIKAAKEVYFGSVK